MYVGALPEPESTLAIAGLGVVFPITIIVSAFANLVGLGGAPLASIALGEKNQPPHRGGFALARSCLRGTGRSYRRNYLAGWLP